MTSPPPLIAVSSPRPLPPPHPWRQLVAGSLSVCLGLFLAAGVVSLLDDSLVLWSGVHLLTAVSGILTFVSFFALLLLYGLIGITPLIPKRIFLPVIFFNLLALLAMFPTLIYHHTWLLQLEIGRAHV